MGRERQKFKNRSSISKVTQKPKSKKQLLHNPIIAANWNQNETLTQNYRRLGLARRLNHSAGGLEKSAAEIEAAESKIPVQDDSLKIKSKLPTKLDVSEARIQRDPETGAILQVFDTAKANPLKDPLNDLEDDDEEVWEGFVNEHGVLSGPTAPSTGVSTDVVRQLEAKAAMPGEKRIRKQSEREEEWIERLVNKYGDDYLKMSRDMKLNPMQQSVGDIKRRVKKWNATHASD